MDYKSVKNLDEDCVRNLINEKGIDGIDWVFISTKAQLSENFIRVISGSLKLSENFIREFKDRIDWAQISAFQKLSEDFIREFKDRIDWAQISAFQKLSEDFIREFQDRVNWAHISVSQKLSEDFIREFKGRVNLDWISKYQKLSEDFRKEFNTFAPGGNWLYTKDEEKLQELSKYDYEVINNCVIAYKGVRSDGYSTFNFQFHYEVGKTYECHCDYNLSDENSFGLSAWTLEKAIEYCNQKIFKVSIPISKLGAIVHSGGKLRAAEMTILEEIKETS